MYTYIGGVGAGPLGIYRDTEPSGCRAGALPDLCGGAGEGGRDLRAIWYDERRGGEKENRV